VKRIAFGLLMLVGCGGDTPKPKDSAIAPGGTKNQADWPQDDRSMCDWKNKTDVEVSETAGPGAIRPNIRRVYKSFGDSETRRKVVICREVDTNLDGIKDVVRTFNSKGEAVKEQADTNYDGKIDVWMSFDQGRVVEEDVDTDFDGRIDVWKAYSGGVLSKIKRDRNKDGKPDVWEIYVVGKDGIPHLERMGVDETGDGHVDHWDRDDLLRQQREAEEARLAAAAAADGGAVSDAGAGDGGAKAPKRAERR
jgi:hypothetical protein